MGYSYDAGNYLEKMYETAPTSSMVSPLLDPYL